MDVTYRKATAGDAREWYIFLNKVWRDAYKDIFPEEVFAYQDSRVENGRNYFVSSLLDKDDKILYVAEHEGKLVGIMWGELYSTYGHFHDSHADLVALYIDPQYQGAKIGFTLKNIFEDWARENKAEKYIIGVLKDNVKARKVYEKWGGKFVPYESEFVRLGVGYKEVFYEFYL